VNTSDSFARPREGAWKSLRGGPVVVFRWRNEPGWPVEFVTPNVLEMFGHSAEDLLTGAVPYASLVHPDDLERLALEVHEAQVLGLQHFEQAYYFLRADGAVRHLYDYTLVLRDEQDKVTHFEGYVLDDTERQEAEQSLRDEEFDSRNLVQVAEVLAGDLTYQELCFHAFEAMRDYVEVHRASLFLQDGPEIYQLKRIAAINLSPRLAGRDLVDLRANPWYEKLMGSEVPAITLDVHQDPNCSGDDFAVADIHSLIAIPIRLSGGRCAHFSVANRRADPPLEDTPRLRRFLSRLGVLFATALERVATLMDQLTMAEQLHQAHKMEAVGLLAGGIAHNFNNALTVILGYSSMLLDDPDLSVEKRAKLDAIFNAGESSAAAVRQLLEFSRKQKSLDPQAIDVGQVLSGLELMLRPLIGEALRLELDIGDSLGAVFLEPGELEMILMNLAVNAKDASGPQGLLQIRVYLEGDEATRKGQAKQVVFEIEDNGSGMSEEVRRRLFEPFFTTKEVGRGTGLGLSAVYGVMKRADGHIEIEEAPSGGTLCRFRLPQFLAPKGVVAPPKKPISSRVHGRRILLVEDQEPVRRFAADSLRMHGFEVVMASNGEEAVELAATLPQPIHLLVSDVVMPGVDGLELCRRFAKLFPDVPILLMSGFVDRVFPDAKPEAQGIPFLRKPFTATELLAAVHQAMEQLA
jgi:PAS domain S-box-containing protein